ncbi:conserved protein of unknown function [Ectopseudomonas oleovorans]|uniref:Uncharacterized protein n=1 Tax=Ectopseudomonas oleovorans TaxID=301 RepID=A0A653B882_ECTOL|nr:conserved protein of unknown function [Pseudomonas oleovorans]
MIAEEKGEGGLLLLFLVANDDPVVGRILLDHVVRAECQQVVHGNAGGREQSQGTRNTPRETACCQANATGCVNAAGQPSDLNLVFDQANGFEQFAAEAYDLEGLLAADELRKFGGGQVIKSELRHFSTPCAIKEMGRKCRGRFSSITKRFAACQESPRLKIKTKA